MFSMHIFMFINVFFVYVINEYYVLNGNYGDDKRQEAIGRL